ncbi:2122_t:CDS:2 [Acaulospora colombiana]|uniref:2122_t:CDS:1 n=1 Tax=Acaulospora colombiana TaxID=27376 RepID=A0ACA9M605_9GLOM|nr:2122_t:CDS:2 [Acaulospora colombiana]
MSILWEYWNLKKQSTPAPDATPFRMRVPYPMAPLGIFWSAEGAEASQEAKERVRVMKAFCDAELWPTFGPDGPSANGTGYGNSESYNPAKADSANLLFGDNYPRLKKIKARYDPSLMFKSWFPIQPAVFRTGNKCLAFTGMPPCSRPAVFKLHMLSSYAKRFKDTLESCDMTFTIPFRLSLLYTQQFGKKKKNSISGMNKTSNIDLKTLLLDAGFTGDLIVPSDLDYPAAILRFAKNAQKRAAIVAYVKTVEDVARVIKFASANSIPLVVKGGGHSTAGASSIENGIVVDLSKYMDAVRIDKEKKLVSVGGGALWKDVDAQAIKHGLAAVSGTMNLVGVGGLTLGGGMGWLMGEHGMVIDNLVQATIVTADGTIRTINARVEPDLFWAIRGGGTNFGCVTEFVYRLYPQRATVYAGPLIFLPSAIEEVTSAMEEWYKGASEKEGAFLLTTSQGFFSGPSVVVWIFFNGDEEEGKMRFKKIIDLIMNLASTLPFEQLNAMLNQFFPYGTNRRISSVMRASLPPSSASTIFNRQIELANIPSAFRAINPYTLAKEPNTVDLAIWWEYLPLKKQSSLPPDATAFRMRVPYPHAAIGVTWSANGVGADAEAKETLEALKSFCEDQLRPTFGPSGPHVDGTGFMV